MMTDTHREPDHLRALIILVDTWRERGDEACAADLEALVNDEHYRVGVWVNLTAKEEE
jgi:hypothetical protein